MSRKNCKFVLHTKCESLQRRIVRGVTPMISAAVTRLIFLAIAFNSTSCNFIIRAIPAAE